MVEIDNLIENFISDLGSKEVLGYLNQIPAGKRLRSKLICEIANEHKDRFLLSSVVELIHLASLLHDDVIDDTALRRGVQTIGATEGSKTAIMVGDIFYSKAYFELSSLGVEVSKIISNAVTSLSLGELMDVRLSESFNTNRSDYLKMIDLKTAALIEASCEAAATLAGKDRAAYKEFGNKLGVAFQVIDDLLDITQDEEVLGKPALNDLTEGKITLPMIDMYQNGSDEDRAKLLELFKKPIAKDDVNWLRTRMQETRALENSKNYALELASKAKELVKADEKLARIADSLIERIR